MCRRTRSSLSGRDDPHAYLLVVGGMIVADPFLRGQAGPPPYFLQLPSQAQNTVLPLAITFLLLWYTDVRRRAAEARVEELSTNAIPRAIAVRLRRGETRIAESFRPGSHHARAGSPVDSAFALGR